MRAARKCRQLSHLYIYLMLTEPHVSLEITYGQCCKYVYQTYKQLHRKQAFHFALRLPHATLRGQWANTFMHEITKSQALQQSHRHIADQGVCLQQAALISSATYDPANRFTQAHADVEVSKVNSASAGTAPPGLI